MDAPDESGRGRYNRGHVMYLMILKLALAASVGVPADPAQLPGGESPVQEDCSVAALAPSSSPVPATPQPGHLLVPSGDDPLEWLRRPTTQSITLQEGHVPLGQLPENATQEMIAASLVGIDRLRTLDLRRSGLRNLDPVSSLSRLEQLVVHDTAVSDLGPLSHLRTLEHLDARSTAVADLAPLRAMQFLKELELDDTAVADVRPLSALRCLERLGLADTRVRDIRALAGLTRLRSLRLDRAPVRSAAPLAKLEQLEELGLEATKIRSVRALARLRNLKVLSLADTEVSEVRPLFALDGLERLDVRGTPLSLAQIEALEEALPFTVVLSTVAEGASEEVWAFEAMQYRAEIASTRFNLAQMLWRVEERREEAVELARRARADFQQNGAFSREEWKEVDRWLREHRGSGRGL